MRIVRDRLVDSQLREQRANVGTRVPEAAEQLLHQASTLGGRHLLGRVRDALLRLARFERLKGRPDHGAESLLGDGAGKLVVMRMEFLFAEVAAGHVT